MVYSSKPNGIVHAARTPEVETPFHKYVTRSYLLSDFNILIFPDRRDRAGFNHCDERVRALL